MNLKSLLKVTSEYTSHTRNMAKEYVLLESGEWFEVGKDCAIVEGQYLLKYSIKENKIISEIVNEKFTICYGISITNICSLFLKKDWFVVSINRVVEEYDKYYILTVKREPDYSVRSFIFREQVSLSKFEDTELCRFLISLYSQN